MRADLTTYEEATGPSVSDRIAVLDIGSNSIRLVIFDAERGRLGQHLVNEKVMCQLGQCVADGGRIDGKPWDTAVAAMGRMATIVAATDVKTLRLIATAAVRGADNAEEIVATIEGLFSCPVEVLTGRQEARMAGKGIAVSIPGASGIVADLGGGSLELTRLTKKGATKHRLSVPCGTLAVQAAIRDCDGSRMEAVRGFLDRALKKTEQVAKLKAGRLYCVGGSWRAIAAFHIYRTGYPLSVVHRYTVSAEKLARFLRQVARWDDERLARANITQSKRRASFREAAVLLLLLIERFDIKQVVFSAAGVREGLMLDSLENGGSQPLAQDLELNAVQALLFGGHRFDPMGPALAAWTRKLRDRSTISKQLWESACWLSDFGWARHPSYKASETASLVLHSNYLLHDHSARAFLSAVVFRRYGGFSLHAVHNDFRQLMPRPVRRQARMLGGALRLAYTLCQGVPELLEGTSLSWTSHGYVLVLPESWQAQTIDGLRDAISFFEDLTNLPLEVRYQ